MQQIYPYFVIQNFNCLYHIKIYLVSFLVCLFVRHQFLNGVSYNDTSDANMRVLSCDVRGGADKSLARPGRKQATANKLGIYSTYSPRSSIHFLARCSNFCKPLKKKFRRLSVQPGLRGSNDLRVGRKIATLQLFFQSREQVIVRRSQILRIRWVIKTLEAQFLLGCKCALWVGALSWKNKAPFVTFPRRFSFKMSFNCTSRVILHFDSLALWKIINEEDAVLIQKNWG